MKCVVYTKENGEVFVEADRGERRGDFYQFYNRREHSYGRPNGLLKRLLTGRAEEVLQSEIRETVELIKIDDIHRIVITEAGD